MGRRSSMGYRSGNVRFYSTRGYGKKKNKGRKKWIIILVALVLLILAGFAGLYFWLSSSNTEDEEIESSVVSEVQESSEDSSEEDEESVWETTDESSLVSSTEVSDDPNIQETYDGNVLIYNNEGYEIFYGTESSAETYAATISSLKEKLGDDVTLYNMVVPVHSAYGLPQRLKETGNDQEENIQTIYSSYTEDVVAIDIYETLQQHSSEYIFFHTDHNWTALGAYYAYEIFCDEAGLEAVDLDSLSSGDITDFLGSLYAATDSNSILAANSDTVTYYEIPGTYTCTLLENGKTEEQTVSLIATFASGSNAYSAFIWGDNPYMYIKTSNSTGRKLCIIKDSYGCAFAPFTVTNYDEIFIVDSRYYEGDIVEYIQENGFTDVLVINGVISANTSGQITCLESIM